MKKEKTLLIIAFVSGLLFIAPLYVKLFSSYNVTNTHMWIAIAFGFISCTALIRNNYLRYKEQKKIH